jgi:hypothetical protein
VLPRQSTAKATVEAKLLKQQSTENKKWQQRLRQQPLVGHGMATATLLAVAVTDDGYSGGNS